MLEGSRIAGEKNIVPDDVTKTEIQRSGKDKIVGSFKLCLTVDGEHRERHDAQVDRLPARTTARSRQRSAASGATSPTS